MMASDRRADRPADETAARAADWRAIMAKLTKAQWDARRTSVRAIDLPDAGIVRLEIAGSTASLPVMLRDFSTGSRGYSASEKLVTEHGAFQVNVTVTQIGSGEYKPAKN